MLELNQKEFEGIQTVGIQIEKTQGMIFETQGVILDLEVFNSV